MISSSTILRRVKSSLGSDFHKLEISDNDIMNIIKEDTLETFSIYFPRYLKTDVFADDLLPEYHGTYMIRSKEQILGVSKLFLDYNGAYTLNTLSSVSPAERQMAADLISMSTLTPTFRFYPPNLIEVFPKTFNNINNKFLIELKVVHADDFSTINPGLKEELIELAILDVKSYIYNIRNEFANNNTLFAEIQLNLDKFSNAEADRKELILKFKSQQHKNSTRQKIWIA